MEVKFLGLRFLLENDEIIWVIIIKRMPSKYSVYLFKKEKDFCLIGKKNIIYIEIKTQDTTYGNL